MCPYAIPTIKIQSQVCSWYTACPALVARSRLEIQAPLGTREGSFAPYAMPIVAHWTCLEFSLLFSLGMNIHFGLRATNVNAVTILKEKTYTATQGTGKTEEKLKHQHF